MQWSYPFANNPYLAFLTALLLAYAAYRLRTITVSGAIAGGLVAAIILFAGGVPLLGLLALFVVTGGLLSRLPNPNNNEQADQHGARTGVQVLATTGIAGLSALLILLPPFSNALWQRALLAAIVVSLGTAFSDTLSAELGSRYGGTPRKLLFGKPVEPGISGGVTLLGLAVGGVAAILFAWLAIVLNVLPEGSERILSLFAFLGNILDSLLGATVQATYRCNACGFITEKTHHCNQHCERVSGLPISNAGVNAICTLVTAVCAIIYYTF